MSFKKWRKNDSLFALLAINKVQLTLINLIYSYTAQITKIFVNYV